MLNVYVKLVFEILAKNKKIFKRIARVNIDQITICCISMDLSQQALQTNEKLFSNFKLVLEILAENQKIF